MTRDILVAIHAGAGIVGLVVGLTVFPPPSTNKQPAVVAHRLRRTAGRLVDLAAGANRVGLAGSTDRATPRLLRIGGARRGDGHPYVLGAPTRRR